MSTSLLILIEIFEFSALYGLLLFPFRGQLKRPPQQIAVSVGLCFALLFIGTFMMDTQMAFITSQMRIVYALVTGLILLKFTVKAPLWARLFNCFLVLCIVGDTFFFVWLLQKMAVGLLPVMSLTFMYLYLYCLVYLIAIPLAVFFMNRLVQPFFQIESTFHHLDKFWLLPFCFFLLFYLFQSIIISNVNDSIFVPYYLIYIGHMSWTLGTFLSCGLLMQYLRGWVNVNTYQSKLDATALHLRMQRREYSRLVETINNTRKLRHDMRHHMALIHSLAQDGDNKEIATYTQDYLRVSGLEESTIVCENHTVNVLVQYYISLAAQNDIHVDTKLNLPEQIHIPESDLASIVGNLLENAVDACRVQEQGKKEISIKGDIVQGNMIAISIRNTYNGKIERKGEAFISSKRPNHQEGIGISSIRSMAERYNGIVQFKYDGGTFEADVLLSQE